MTTDIHREITLARASSTDSGKRALESLGVIPGGGNLLAALGLVAYTEALGLIRMWNQSHRYGSSHECFLAFFDRMNGGSYKSWRSSWEAGHAGTTLYEALRCGLVHEYRPKVDSEFWIGEGEPLGLADSSGTLVFKVEPYLRHFAGEALQLYRDLSQLANPELPPPKTQVPPRSPPSLPPTPSVSPTS